jgi:maleate isomerase
MTDGWERLAPRYGEGLGERASIGIIALGTDRVGAIDTEAFLSAQGVAVFSTRVPMASVATPQSLAAMGEHLEAAAGLIVPGTGLDAMVFSCTSGTVAIGPERVRAAIRRARPGIAVATPMEGGAEGLKRLGARRIALVVPYLVPTANLVSGFFEEQGFTILRRATFELDGDPDMNRVSPDALIRAAADTDTADADAVFISCTGLRTAPVVAAAEKLLGKPVVTSNQAVAWQALRLAGIADQPQGRGMLFERA